MQRLTSFIADEVRFVTVDPPENTLMRRMSPAVIACKPSEPSALSLPTEDGRTHAEWRIKEGILQLAFLTKYVKHIGAGSCSVGADGKRGEAMNSRAIRREELAVHEDLIRVVVRV